jgi:predicted HicB family RNase H-like nuclease
MDREQETCLKAREVSLRAPDWATFFREVLGVGGIVRQMFPTSQALAEFEKTPEYAEIQAMLVKLREKNLDKSPESEPTRVITVRLPKSLHEALSREAIDHETSVNQLCISKLVRLIEDNLVPTGNPPRKRKPRQRQEDHEESTTAEVA